MKPYLTLAETTTPEGEPLTLVSHDGHYYLQSRGQQLMTTFAYGSEEDLATLGCAPFRQARQPLILIGGLGFAFTLNAATKALPQKHAHFLVAEQTPAIIQWHHTHLRELHPGLWNDDRIEIRPHPVQKILTQHSNTFSAILLDVDNGPWAFHGDNNENLYTHQGLLEAKTALKEGGLLAIWSARHDRDFERRLTKAGFTVTCEKVPATKKGKQNRFHTIWLARNGTYTPKTKP
ncbi:MAG: spermidine synthase [Verrucomicrobiota bacterium]